MNPYRKIKGENKKYLKPGSKANFWEAEKARVRQGF